MAPRARRFTIAVDKAKLRPRERTLTITADDFGLHPSYDRGILEAAAAGAIDAAGVMVLRAMERLGALLESRLAIGLHLEAKGGELSEGEALAQLERFEQLAARPPDYLDGHHHCHAAPAVASAVAAIAADLGVPVRSVDDAHRRILRAAGVPTPDLLVGRYEECEPVIPAELLDPPRSARRIEWIVHPGYPDPDSGSDYDAGRGEDLDAVLNFTPPAGIRRAGHRLLRG